MTPLAVKEIPTRAMRTTLTALLVAFGFSERVCRFTIESSLKQT